MPIFNRREIIKKKQFSMHNPLIKSMVIVGAITLIIKLLAFYKETIIASSFGLSEVLDTFLVAILIPTFVQSVFLNSLKHLFIPNYIAELKSNGNKASFQTIIFLMTLAVSFISIIFTYIFIDLFLESFFPSHSVTYYTLVKSQLYIILPCIILWGFSSVISGLLEIKNRFLLATIYQLFPLLTMLFFLFYLKESIGNMVLAYGTLVGSIVGFLFLLIFAIRHKDLALSKPIINNNSKMMLIQLPPKITSSFLSSMNTFIDQFFVGQLIVGSLAALNYGNRIPAFGVTIVIMALGNVLLPHFSRLVNEDIQSAYNYLFKILKSVLVIGIIASIIMIFFSDWIVEIWLERGEFSHDDTLKVSTVQKILLVNVPFYICTLIIVKFLTSINENKFMAKISFINLIINIILNIILIKQYGIFGLALSTTAVLIISSSMYFAFTYRKFKKINK